MDSSICRFVVQSEIFWDGEIPIRNAALDSRIDIHIPRTDKNITIG